MNQIEKISELYAKATPGPWKHYRALATIRGPGNISIADVEHSDNDFWDAPLIVALHEAWPAIEKALKAGDELASYCNGYTYEHKQETHLGKYLEQYQLARKEIEG